MSSAPPKTIIDLPIELIEMIGMNLIEYAPHNDSVAPVIPRLLVGSCQAVYNTRLACRGLSNALKKAFLEVLHDVPFQCTEEHLGRLTRLLQLAWVSQSFKQLTIGGAKIAKTPIQRSRAVWIQDHLADAFKTILSIAPRLESIRCVPIFESFKPNDPRDAYDKDTADETIPERRQGPFRSVDIFGKLYTSIHESGHAETLMSLLLGSDSVGTFRLGAPGGTLYRGQIRLSPFLAKPLPHLQHLVLDLGCLRYGTGISSSTQMPVLESLTIVYTTFLDNSERNVGPWPEGNLDLLAKTQPRRLVLTSYRYVTSWLHEPREKILAIVRAFSHRQGPLPCLELRDMDVELDYHRDERPMPADTWKFSEDFRIAEFKIANVTWYRHVIHRDSSERRGWCKTGWELFPQICDASDVVRVRVCDESGLIEESFLERPYEDLHIDGNSTDHDTETDRSTTEDGFDDSDRSTDEDEDDDEDDDGDEDDDEDEDEDDDHDNDAMDEA